MKPFFAFGEWHSYGEMEEVNTSSVSPELLQSLVCSRLLKNLPLEQLHRKTIFKKNTKVMNYEWPLLKKCFEEPNQLYGFLTKYHGSLNNPSRANSDFREQIFAPDCNKSGEGSK